MLAESPNPIQRGMNLSPDGRFVVYGSTSPSTKGDIWALPLGGDRKPIPLVQTKYDESSPQVSPDGNWLAYRSDRTGRMEIHVRLFPNGPEEYQVSTDSGWAVKWRGDSRELFWAKPGAARLFSSELRVDGSSVQPGKPRELIPTFGNDYVPAPDGQRFLLLTTAP